MSNKKVKVVKESNVSNAGSDAIFFAGQYPDWMTKKTDMEWVKYMNKKYGFNWNGKDTK